MPAALGILKDGKEALLGEKQNWCVTSVPRQEIGGLKKRNRLSFRRILAINIEGMIELANHHYAIPHVM